MPTHAGAYDGFEELTAEHTAQVKSFAYLQAVVTPVGLYGMPAALSCTLWSWRTLLKPVLLKLMLPGFLVSLAFGLVNVSLLYDGDATLVQPLFPDLPPRLLPRPALVRAGNVTKNPLRLVGDARVAHVHVHGRRHRSTVKSAPSLAGAQKIQKLNHVPPQHAPGVALRRATHSRRVPARRPPIVPRCSSEQAASKVVDCTRFFRSCYQVQYHFTAVTAQLDQGVLSFRPLAARTTPPPQLPPL